MPSTLRLHCSSGPLEDVEGLSCGGDCVIACLAGDGDLSFRIADLEQMQQSSDVKARFIIEYKVAGNLRFSPYISSAGFASISSQLAVRSDRTCLQHPVPSLTHPIGLRIVRGCPVVFAARSLPNCEKREDSNCTPWSQIINAVNRSEPLSVKGLDTRLCRKVLPQRASYYKSRWIVWKHLVGREEKPTSFCACFVVLHFWHTTHYLTQKLISLFIDGNK